MGWEIDDERRSRVFRIGIRLGLLKHSTQRKTEGQTENQAQLRFLAYHLSTSFVVSHRDSLKFAAMVMT
jgi:hypothetical protein